MLGYPTVFIDRMFRVNRYSYDWLFPRFADAVPGCVG